MKIFFKIILFILISLSFFSLSNFTYAVEITTNTNMDKNLDIGVNKGSNRINNDHLNVLKTDDDFDVGGTGPEAITNSLFKIAKDLKNVFFIVAGFYFIVLVIKLIFSEESEEAVGNFKKGLVWITIGLIITQISYSFVKVLYGEGIGEGLADRFNQDIMYPLIKLLETGASFVFVAVAIYAFFRMITADGDEEKTKSGKMTILYSIIGFIVIKFSRTIVDSIYGKIDCNDKTLFGIVEVSFNECTRESDLSSFAQMIVTIIDWMNSLIGIFIIILIIYAGAQVIFNIGDEERLKKAKNSILFIAIGLFLLFANYLILTFFLIPESTI